MYQVLLIVLAIVGTLQSTASPLVAALQSGSSSLSAEKEIICLEEPWKCQSANVRRAQKLPKRVNGEKKCNLWEPLVDNNGETINCAGNDQACGHSHICVNEVCCSKGQGPCHEQYQKVTIQPGAFLPSCRDNGYFESQQCHGSTGYCWCSDHNGNEIPGTKSSPGQAPVDCGYFLNEKRCNLWEPLVGSNGQPINCAGNDQVCGSSHICVNEVCCSKGQGPCHVEYQKMENIPGAFAPSCRDDGYFDSIQCHGSSGYCWCSDQYGKEIPGTKSPPGQAPVDCGYFIAEEATYCNGYIDVHGNWNNGFHCPRLEDGEIQYCCGNENHKYCCVQ